MMLLDWSHFVLLSGHDLVSGLILIGIGRLLNDSPEARAGR